MIIKYNLHNFNLELCQQWSELNHEFDYACAKRPFPSENMQY